MSPSSTPASPAPPCRLFVVVTVIMEGTRSPCVLTRPVRYVPLSLPKGGSSIIATVRGVTLRKQVAHLCPLRFELEFALLPVQYTSFKAERVFLMWDWAYFSHVYLEEYI